MRVGSTGSFLRAVCCVVVSAAIASGCACNLLEEAFRAFGSRHGGALSARRRGKAS